MTGQKLSSGFPARSNTKQAAQSKYRSWRLEISDLETRESYHLLESKKQSSSVPLFFMYAKSVFSSDVACMS